MKLYQELHWRVPSVFSVSQALTVSTDGRRNGAAFVVFPTVGTKTKITKISFVEDLLNIRKRWLYILPYKRSQNPATSIQTALMW